MISNDARPVPTLVVGVEPGQRDVVVQRAADLARALGGQLVCAHVDSARVVSTEEADGSVTSEPVDPDLDEDASPFPDDLRARIEELLAPTGVEGRVLQLAGDPAAALARLGDRLDAEMIVVGTRHAGLRGALEEVLDGSVAAHLSHRQHRPVLVVPQGPARQGGTSRQEPA